MDFFWPGFLDSLLGGYVPSWLQNGMQIVVLCKAWLANQKLATWQKITALVYALRILHHHIHDVSGCRLCTSLSWNFLSQWSRSKDIRTGQIEVDSWWGSVRPWCASGFRSGRHWLWNPMTSHSHTQADGRRDQ